MDYQLLIKLASTLLSTLVDNPEPDLADLLAVRLFSEIVVVRLCRSLDLIFHQDKLLSPSP